MRYTIRVAGNVERTSKPSPDVFAQPPCVLLIDDEDETRDMLGELLRRAGYLVVTARNGVEALEVLQTVRPSLIVLDLQMPIMDGYSFREAQRRTPALITIPTVVLTGTDYEPMLDPAFAESLRKRVSCSRLLQAIERHCGSQHR
jgi:CheY-like chemotaxis protein